MIRSAQGFPAWHPINKRTGELHQFVRSSYKVTKGFGAILTIPDKPRNAEMLSKLSVAQKGGWSRKGGRNARSGPNRPAPPRPVLALGRADEFRISRDLMAWITSGGTL